MVVEQGDWDAWLSPDTTDPLRLVLPAMSGRPEAVKVSTLVNNVKNNGRELLEPVS